MVKESTQQAIYRLERVTRQLKNQAKIPADRDTNGFMSTKMVQNQNQIFNVRANPDTTNLLDLKPGFYKCYGLLGHPIQPTTATTWVSVVDVTTTDDGRKLIKLTDTYTGMSWWRVVMSDGADAGMATWAQIRGEVILWEGNSKMVNEVTLSQPIINKSGSSIFKEIKCKYTTDMGQFGWAYCNPTNSNEIRINTVNLGSTKLVMNVYEATLSLDAKTAQATQNDSSVVWSNSESGPTYTKSGDAGVNITQIVGVI